LFINFFRKKYFNFVPYSPRRLFSNWNVAFYKTCDYDDILSLDTVENPIQFIITKDRIIKTSQRLNRKINLVITAFGTGAILKTIENNFSELENYLNSITLTDIRDIDLEKWTFLNSLVKIKKQIGDITNPDFVKTLNGDMFYGNELLEDIPNRFIFKADDKLFDIWIRAYSKNNLPPFIRKTLKKALFNIYYLGKLPPKFSPELGKIFSFDIAHARRVRDKDLEDIYEEYPNNSFISIAEGASNLLFELYKQIPKGGTILFHDYGFFSPENLHLIKNMLRENNPENSIIKNNYGEFTTNSSYDFLYQKLKKNVSKITIKKTIEHISNLTNIPQEIINLDAENIEIDFMFFVELIKERFQIWEMEEACNIKNIIKDYVDNLKQNKISIDRTLEQINFCVNDILTQNQKETLKKILLGYFNNDNHRFLTIEIEK